MGFFIKKRGPAREALGSLSSRGSRGGRLLAGRWRRLSSCTPQPDCKPTCLGGGVQGTNLGPQAPRVRGTRPTWSNFSVILCTTFLPSLLWYNSAVTIPARGRRKRASSHPCLSQGTPPRPREDGKAAERSLGGWGPRAPCPSRLSPRGFRDAPSGCPAGHHWTFSGGRSCPHRFCVRVQRDGRPRPFAGADG